MEDQFVIGLFVGGIIGYLMNNKPKSSSNSPVSGGNFVRPAGSTNNNAIAPGAIINPAARRGYLLRTYPNAGSSCSIPYLNNATKVL